MNPVDQILTYMEKHPGASAKQAAEALGLPAKAAREARKQRNASRTRARDKVVALAPPVEEDLTCESLAFWERELRLVERARERAAQAESWTAYANLTTKMHAARAAWEAAAEKDPPNVETGTDAELMQELEQELAALPASLRKLVQ